jgi:hypothetical protein
MEKLKTQLDSYISVNDRQKQVTGQLQNILPEQVPEAEFERVFLADTIRDTFPPVLLYHPDVLAGPTTLYHVIRGVLLLLSRPFNQVRITGIPARVSLGVARQMYKDEDAELALEMAEYISATRRFKVKLQDRIKAQKFTTTGSHQRMSDTDSDSATAK